MKKVLIVMLVAIGLYSCNKDDDTVFDQSPDERLNKKLEEYQAALSGAVNGWKGIIITDSTVAGAYEGVYHFFFRFDNSNRVKMYSDWDSTSAVTVKESSYRLKALQQPSLLFDTYSYIHVLADPDPNVNGGDPNTNTGLYSDFEFYFDSATTDSITLIGRFNGSKMILVRATKQEADAYDNKQLGNAFVFNNINRYLNYFKRITVGGVVYEIKVNVDTRIITLSWLNSNGVLQTFSTPYYYSLTGINFASPLVNGNQTISGFTNITWSLPTLTLGFSVNGNATTVVGSGQPIKVDLNAPRRWWLFAADQDNYWVSINGFHVNGVDNAYRIDTITSGSNRCVALIYWPNYNPSGPPYDLFGPLFVMPAGGLTLEYGTAPSNPPTFTADGRAVFVQLGNLGPYPTTGAAALSRAQLYNANGYYFVQTSPTSYDMVSALNGTTWITWEF